MEKDSHRIQHNANGNGKSRTTNGSAVSKQAGERAYRFARNAGLSPKDAKLQKEIWEEAFRRPHL